MKNKRTCARGHIYFKTSDCPTCPLCERQRKPTNNLLSLIAAPAWRALENKGIKTLKQLAHCSEDEILSLHGIGKSSILKLKSSLLAAGLSFKKDQ